MFLFTVLAILVLYGVRAAYIRQKLPKGTKWLPGPPGIPFIGRIWDIPRTHSYLRFKKWTDIYGPIYQINVFGINHVWVGTDKIANDLLVKRGSLYSDRPPINNLENSKAAPEYLPLLGHNEIWRRQRKFVHNLMTQSAAASHQYLPYLECHQFLAELIDNPPNYEHIMESYTGRVVSRLAFGDVRHYVEVSIHSHALLNAISPAAYASNIIPQLRRLPAWLSPWKRWEQARHERERAWFLQMHGEVEEKVKGGVQISSFMRTFLESREKIGMSDMEGAYVVGMIGLAGLLTTASALMTYLLAMCLHPEWQARLQHEVDTVCGGRMPETTDAPRMPVLRAVIKEIMRWRPVTPSSIPHELEKDDVYEGYFLPAGTHIHPSQWAITRDAATYPDPETFNPERWLSPTYPTYQTPLSIYPNIKGFTTFGYGRRVCQGVDLVEAELLVAIGGMAWACQISRKRDEKTGEEIVPPAHDYTSLLISRPKMFPFVLEARSEERRKEVWANWREAERVLGEMDGSGRVEGGKGVGVQVVEEEKKGGYVESQSHAPRVVVAAA